VADFGIAKVTGSIGAGLTRMGAFVGTPQYAAPEQFIGEPASDKSDVYSLGAVMVFMMTARPMVPDAHTLASEDVYAQLMEVLPPGISRKSDTPEDCERISQILAYAMRIEPKNRCTVSELLVMLEQFLDSSETNFGVLDRDLSSELTSEQYEDMATVHGDADHPVIAPTTSLTRKDRDERSELRFADSNETPSGVEAPADMDGVETDKDESEEATKTSSGDPSQDVDHGASKHHPKARSFRGLRGSIFVWGLVVVLGVYIAFPSALDGLPLRGGWPADSASDPSAAKWARRALKNAVKLNRQSIRRACKTSGGEGIEIEAVLNSGGQVRWARPAKKLDAQAWCVAFTLSGSNSGYTTLQKPSKVKLTVWP
jgi:serine/threonine protein kinase